MATDLKIRGAGAIYIHTLDANSFREHNVALEQALVQLGGIDVALIAQGILKGINKNKPEIYLPFFWRYIKMIPEKIFVRLSL